MLNLFCKFFNLHAWQNNILIFPFDEMLKLFLKLISSLWKSNYCKTISTKSSLSIAIIPKWSHIKKLYPTKSKLFPLHKIAPFLVIYCWLFVQHFNLSSKKKIYKNNCSNAKPYFARYSKWNLFELSFLSFVNL